jgi:hypothetical protein
VSARAINNIGMAVVVALAIGYIAKGLGYF